jgi:hypothetical protein
VQTPSAAPLPLALGLAADTAMPRQLQQRLAGALIVVPRGQSLPSTSEQQQLMTLTLMALEMAPLKPGQHIIYVCAEIS